MKYLKYFLTLGIILLLVSFHTPSTSRLSESIYPGNLFPDIRNLENVSGTKLNLSDLQGQKVLVVFWAAYDAESHKDNVLFANTIAKNNYPVKMVSISFDQSESIYARTIGLDGIDSRYQFLAKENYNELFDRYQLNKGFRAYLLDENGMTVAMNVKTNDLNNLLASN